MARSAAARSEQSRIDLEMDLATIVTAPLSELREIWRDRLGQDPPPLRGREILRRMLAYRIQEAIYGGLSAASGRKLDKIEERRRNPALKASAPPLRLTPGTILTREWKGVRHEVKVGVDGFDHQGQTYKSLSEVARVIAGSRWNGPLFFGLRDKPRAAA